MSSAYPSIIHAADGVALATTWYEPVGATRGGVLVAGGLGIRQRFYAPFAQWLCARGWRVLTFDLRGMGDSRASEHRRSLRGLNADMLTWARQDFAAAVQHLSQRQQGEAIALVGHSLGLHHAGMTTAAAQDCIAVAVSVAAGSGYWRDWATPSRRKAPLMLHLAGPLLTTLLGWFPGRRLRMVGDLPGPAMRQWTRWCRHPQFAWGAEPHEVLPGLHRARFAIHAFSFTDDDAMTEACTRKLLAAFAQAPSTLQVLRPAEVGLPSIGHVGAFRPEAAGNLWPRFEALIEASVSPRRQ